MRTLCAAASVIFAMSVAPVAYGQQLIVPDGVSFEVDINQDGHNYFACGIGVHALVSTPNQGEPTFDAYDVTVALTQNGGTAVKASTYRMVRTGAGFEISNEKAPLTLAFGLPSANQPIPVHSPGTGPTPGALLGVIQGKSGSDVFVALATGGSVLAFFQLDPEGNDRPVLSITGTLKPPESQALIQCMRAIVSHASVP